MRSYLSAFMLVVMVGLFWGNATYQAQYGWPVADSPLMELQLDSEFEINDAEVNDKLIIALATNSGVLLYNDYFMLLAHIHAGDRVKSVTWSPDTLQLAVALDYQNKVEVWNWDDSTNTLDLEETLITNGFPYNILWSPDGRFLVSLGLEYVEIEGFEYNYPESVGRLMIWDTVDWQANILPQMYNIGIDLFYPQRLNWNPNLPSQLIVAMDRMKFENGRLVSDGMPDYFPIITINTINDITYSEINIGLKDIELTMSVDWQNGGSLLAVPDSLGGVFLHDTNLGGEQVAEFSNREATLIRYLDWNYNGTLLIADNLVIDVQRGVELGFFDTDHGVVTAIWLDKGSYYGEYHRGKILIVENLGRLTIQDIHSLRDYVAPTSQFTPTETPFEYELTVSPTPSHTPEPTQIPRPYANAGK